MSAAVSASLIIALAYLIGSIPFGYLVARAKGVDIFHAGSGNIGATNVARVVGQRFGIFVFVLDFGKGALGVGLVDLLAPVFGPMTLTAFGPPDLLRVGAATAAFLGHLFPIYLRLHGGKGVATGAGAVFVLLPGPTVVALITWLATVSATRLVSLGSLSAVVVLIIARLLSVPQPFADNEIILTLFCLIGGALVFVKHHTNIQRLFKGTEPPLADQPMWRTMSKVLHVMAVGLWFGSAIFFNFIAAPLIFAEFEKVVETAPNDRTANIDILRGVDENEQDKAADRLSSALAGTAVGPLFGPFFALGGICGVIALVTSVGWCCSAPRRRVDKIRSWVMGLALLTVAVSWPISEKVSSLRVERYSSDSATSEAATAAFAEWHLVSLLLSFVTAILVTVGMLLAAKLPGNGNQQELSA